MRDVLDAIAAFNARTPILPITSDSIRKSLHGKAVHEAGMEEGLYLPRPRQPLRERYTFGNF
jgi:hypothetical protein